jgi:hypothetical protein
LRISAQRGEKMRITTLLLLLLGILSPSVAQPSVQGSEQANGSGAMNAESIFNQILQSMPAQAKVRLDSASQARSVDQRTAVQHTNSGNGTPSLATPPMQDAALNQLPRELQERVQKTMRELEQDNQRRAVEFKDRAARTSSH